MLGLGNEPAQRRRSLLSMREEAERDPRFVVAMLGGCGPNSDLIYPERVGGWLEVCRASAWEIINVKGCFTSDAAGQCIDAEVQNLCGYDLTVRDVVYTVRTPNAWPGSVLGPQARFFNGLKPDINFKMLIKSFCPYVISADFTPLENLPQRFECYCEFNMILTCGACIIAQFVNCRPLLCSDPASTDPCCPGEVPTEVVISIHGIRLPAPYNACGLEAARAVLMRYGVLPKAAQVVP